MGGDEFIYNLDYGDGFRDIYLQTHQFVYIKYLLNFSFLNQQDDLKVIK